MANDNKLVFPFHYGNEPDQYYFYKVPKILFHDPDFAGLSTDAKLLYGILLDRMELSKSNNWMDEAGRIYIYYTIENIMKELQCGNKKAGNLLAELDDNKGIGLITRVHQGLTKPDKIFVHKLVKRNGQEMSRGHPLTCQNDSSGDVKGTALDMSEGRTNETNIINTEINNTESIYLGDSFQTDLTARYQTYEEYFKQKLDVDVLLFDYPYYGDQIQEFIDILVETCCSERPTIRIGKEEKPTAIVKSRLMKLNSEHIRYVLDRIHENTTDVRNIKQYLLTTLYNAPMTISNYYTAKVNYDMYGSLRGGEAVAGRNHKQDR